MPVVVPDKMGDASVLLDSVCASVIKANVSFTDAKLGMVSVAPPTVCAVVARVSV